MTLRHAKSEEVVGRGSDAYARTRRMLFDYTFYPPSIVSAPGPVTLGIVLDQRIRVGPLRLRGPVRVVALWDEPDRCGYRYEALAGHVERGVAEFELKRVGDEVTFRYESDSAPGPWWARVGAPFARYMQRRAVAAAMERMRRAAALPDE